jgi:hypothetical protein
MHNYFVSATETWMAVGRWKYDPSRGLRLECKKPQLADTELKELGYADSNTSGSILLIFIWLTSN